MVEYGFSKFDGDLMGLPTDHNHANYRWNHPDYNIIFSVARQGNACSCHFAADKKSLRKVKKAINKFCEFVFREHDWCKYIFAKVKKESVGRAIEKCGFVPFAEAKDMGVTAYVRGR